MTNASFIDVDGDSDLDRIQRMELTRERCGNSTNDSAATTVKFINKNDTEISHARNPYKPYEHNPSESKEKQGSLQAVSSIRHESRPMQLGAFVRTMGFPSNFQEESADISKSEFIIPSVKDPKNAGRTLRPEDASSRFGRANGTAVTAALSDNSSSGEDEGDEIQRVVVDTCSQKRRSVAHNTADPAPSKKTKFSRTGTEVSSLASGIRELSHSTGMRLQGRQQQAVTDGPQTSQRTQQKHVKSKSGLSGNVSVDGRGSINTTLASRPQEKGVCASLFSRSRKTGCKPRYRLIYLLLKECTRRWESAEKLYTEDAMKSLFSGKSLAEKAEASLRSHHVFNELDQLGHVRLDLSSLISKDSDRDEPKNIIDTVPVKDLSSEDFYRIICFNVTEAINWESDENEGLGNAMNALTAAIHDTGKTMSEKTSAKTQLRDNLAAQLRIEPLIAALCRFSESMHKNEVCKHVCFKKLESSRVVGSSTEDRHEPAANLKNSNTVTAISQKAATVAAKLQDAPDTAVAMSQTVPAIEEPTTASSIAAHAATFQKMSRSAVWGSANKDTLRTTCAVPLRTGPAGLREDGNPPSPSELLQSSKSGTSKKCKTKEAFNKRIELAKQYLWEDPVHSDEEEFAKWANSIGVYRSSGQGTVIKLKDTKNRYPHLFRAFSRSANNQELRMITSAIIKEFYNERTKRYNQEHRSPLGDALYVKHRIYAEADRWGHREKMEPHEWKLLFNECWRALADPLDPKKNPALSEER